MDVEDEGDDEDEEDEDEEDEDQMGNLINIKNYLKMVLIMYLISLQCFKIQQRYQVIVERAKAMK